MQADISGWWDTQHRILGPILNGFISDHPDWFGVVAAAGTVMGELRFTDRAGNVVDSLAQLETLDSAHAGIGHATVHGVAASIDGLRVLMVSGRAVLAMEVRMQLAADPVTVAQALAVRGQAIPPPGTRQHVLSGGDDLCSLASTYYGGESKWPLIEEANGVLAKGSAVFLTPGDTLLIYPAPSASALEHHNGWGA